MEQVSPWNGRMVAYSAKDGSKLWESPVGTGVGAAPMTYMLDGKQYVAVGWGGVYGLMNRATEHQGPAFDRGMSDFTGKPSSDDVQAIKAFIQGTADAVRPK